MTEKFERKGLTIIGVTDEPTAKIKPFIEKEGIKYLIAIGNAPGYETTGIPHAWLVSPKGTIVWEGQSKDLTDAKIEEHLKDVVLAPTFALPKELKNAEKDLNAGNYAGGVKALETYLKKPGSAEAAAKEALEKVKAHGTRQLQIAEELAAAREYADAADLLTSVQKSFKGQEPAEKAKSTLDAWKKDKTIQLEIEASRALAKANALIAAKQYKSASGILLTLAKQKKYEGTKAQELARKKYTQIEKFL